MITLIAVLFIALLCIQILCYLKEDAQLKKLLKEEKIQQIPLFTSGKKLNSFTIEESKMVEASVVVGMNMLRRIWMFFLSFIYRSAWPYKWLHNYGYRLALARLFGKAKDENYFVNIKPTFTHLPHGKLEVHISATGIKLYKDTLGIYQLPASPYKGKMFLGRKKVFSNFINTLILYAVALAFALYFLMITSNGIIKKITIKDEEVLWSYLKTSAYLEIGKDKEYLQNTELKLNYILSAIVSASDIKKYEYYVMVVDDNNAAMYLLPNGRIVMTKGLLSMVSSKQEVEFMIADAVAHMELGHHLQNIGYNIITPYYAIQLFGDDSFFAKWIVRSSSFYNVKFDAAQEFQSNELALLECNKLNREILSITLFDENILIEESEYIHQHPMSKENLSLITSKREFKQGHPTPLELELLPPAIKLVETTQTPEQLGEFEKVMTEMDKEFNALYNSYNTSMNPLNDVLDPSTLAREDHINYKKDILSYGEQVVDYYSNQLNEKTKELNAKAALAYNNSADKEKAAYNNAVYNKAVSKFTNMMKFYFERDLDVIKNQRNILNFLTKRMGNYSVSKSGLIFSSRNDQQSYDELVARVRELKGQQYSEN